jgi:glucosylceramidase
MAPLFALLVCFFSITSSKLSSCISSLAYYSMAHASKFIPPGSIQLQSTNWEQHSHTSFVREDGRIVIIVVNNKNVCPARFHSPSLLTVQVDSSLTIRLMPQNLTLTSHLPARSAATYIWPPLDSAMNP